MQILKGDAVVWETWENRGRERKFGLAPASARRSKRQHTQETKLFPSVISRDVFWSGSGGRGGGLFLLPLRKDVLGEDSPRRKKLFCLCESRLCSKIIWAVTCDDFSLANPIDRINTGFVLKSDVSFSFFSTSGGGRFFSIFLSPCSSDAAVSPRFGIVVASKSRTVNLRIRANSTLRHSQLVVFLTHRGNGHGKIALIARLSIYDSNKKNQNLQGQWKCNSKCLLVCKVRLS